MYPERYYSLFPPFPRRGVVFVIMSFADCQQRRWEEVIRPAIQATYYQGSPLDAERVDVRWAGDSILTDILEGIGGSRLVLADVTAMTKDDHGKAYRNDNVMYELGIAHSCRAPEEVIVVRSDDESLSFDLAPVRVHKYDPDGDPAGAQMMLQSLLHSALHEQETLSRAAVMLALNALDSHSMGMIPVGDTPIEEPPLKTTDDAILSYAKLGAIRSLLRLGIIHAEVVPLAEVAEGHARVRYKITPFGVAVGDAFRERAGISPELLALVKDSIAAAGGA